MQINDSDTARATLTTVERSAPQALRVERLPMKEFALVRDLNEQVFGDRRVLFSLDHEDLVPLVAYRGSEPIGYKVGYAETEAVFYSAKGGVLERARRQGVARGLLYAMMNEARKMGYRRFAFDTFPNKHPGMTVMALTAGFRVASAGYNAAYRDYRLRFEQWL